MAAARRAVRLAVERHPRRGEHEAKSARAVVVGVALLLSGVGFAVLSIGAALRSGDSMKPVALGSEATPAPSGA